MATVTFETKCYERDWKFLLLKGRLERMVKNCDYSFAERVLMINNVADLKIVKKAADALIARDVISAYVVVAELEKETLDFFKVTKDSFKGGYYYSIAELASIYRCKSEFLLHFSGDSVLEEKKYPWINEAISIMKSDDKIVVANPVWDNHYPMAKAESIRENDQWYTGYGFSDQCYLIPVKRFQAPVYSEINSAGDRYPVYGGELFEKRVDAWMRNNALLRITSKHISYAHRNFPKSGLRRFYDLYLKKSEA